MKNMFIFVRRKVSIIYNPFSILMVGNYGKRKLLPVTRKFLIRSNFIVIPVKKGIIWKLLLMSRETRRMWQVCKVYVFIMWGIFNVYIHPFVYTWKYSFMYFRTSRYAYVCYVHFEDTIIMIILIKQILSIIAYWCIFI